MSNRSRRFCNKLLSDTHFHSPHIERVKGLSVTLHAQSPSTITSSGVCHSFFHLHIFLFNVFQLYVYFNIHKDNTNILESMQ